jgi:TPR repeat protein
VSTRVPLLLALTSALLGCSQTYHPEFHPETRYSFVQNISMGAPEERCDLGRTAACWCDCFARSHGDACYLLGVMFETGHGVPRSHDDAVRMSLLAAKLGYAPASIDVDMAAPYIDLWGHDQTTTVGVSKTSTSNVSSTGGVVVYGSVNGDIILGSTSTAR